MAVVLETRLGDRMGALEAHRRALDADASDDSARAAVRLAGSLGDWAAAAHAVVRFAHAGSPVAVGALLETLERAVFEAGAWREAATALAAAAGSTAVEGADARDLYTRVANWLIRDGADPDGAEGALKLALGHDPGNLELLKRLAELQRRDPDRELLTTLLALADVGAEPLDALREAATIARSVLGNFGLARDFARRAIERVRVLGCELPADNGAAWAVETLVAVAEHDGDDDALVTALITASELLLPSEARREMRRRAARISLDRLGDTKRGLALFERLFDDDPGDAEAGERLARAYDEETRRSDLLRLRGRQIEAARDLTTRLALRLELARLLADGGQADAAVDTLRAALGESPRDAAAVDRLASLLERGGRGAELRDLLREQAELAERAGDVSTAATWWSKAAACVARGATGDLALAAEFYRRAVTLGADPRWCDALARIAETRGEYDEAAGWHERVASASDGAHKEQALLRLADALVRAGRSEAAIDRIEAALEVDPGAEALQERLAQLYESQRDWTRLAELTARRSEQTHDKATRITCLARAARLFAGECSRPDRAIPLLERAADLVPEDRSLRLALAAALAESGRLGDARAVLRALIDSFGGRKPKERALVHYQMALLELSCGDRARAMTELDTAWRVDPQSAEILRRLAGLARDEGQLERAEKSYRALLVVLRRRDEDVSGVDAVARSEILVELSAIAQRRGEAERAREILESAVEAGLESEFEQTRLEIALRASGDVATLRRLFDSRLAAIGGSPSGSMLLRLGRLAEQDLGDDSGAAVLYERAVAHGHAPLELLRALDGVYVRLGDGENGARVLAMRVEAELGDGAGGSEAADALYRLAALRLAAPTTLDAGAELLQRALDLEPRLDFAEQALQSALAIGPAHPRLIDLLERVGRHEGRERALVDALSRRAQQEDAPMEAVRAAIDTAVAAGDAATAEALLQRRIHGGTGLSSADLAWARAALAALRFRQGDFAHAARLYGELHAEAPADRAFWEALAEVYRRQGDAARLAALVAEVVDSVDDARERAQLRLERIRALRRSGALDDGAAVRELREVLDEAPGHLEAAQWLADLLEARGDTAELVALLALQLDAARDRADASSVASLALRLGKLVEARAPGDRAPRDWYYTGLEWAPESPELLDALLGLLSSEDDAFERADVLERRLAVERGATPRPSH
jgi:tetratricopeptide (TPR) repeat protein